DAGYHALSAKLQQRFTRGLTYLVGYTWSKSIDSGSAILVKNTRIHESHSLQFRFEAFNFANHPNWNAPSSDSKTASTFGKITSARTMREMQFGLLVRMK